MGGDETEFDHLGAERNQLLQRKLGILLTWRPPQIVQTVGPFDPAAFDRYDLRRRKAINACVERLTSLSDEEIDEILKNPNSTKPDVHEWTKLLNDELHALRLRVPAWYIGGFGHPDHVADFDYWTKMPQFTVAELTCLSIGINPAEFGVTQLVDLSASKDRPKLCRPLEYLVLRYEQLYRTFGRYRRDTIVYPDPFILWVNKVQFEVHPAFFEPLVRYHSESSPAPEAGSPGKQDQREVDKIAQLFTALAIDNLGYDPNQSRSPTAREIGEIAASMGMSITDETIRKYLRLGAEFIPKDWKPKKR